MDWSLFVKIVIIIIYLGVIAVLGVMGYRRTKTAGDYLLGRRKTHPMIMALSYGATFISTSAIVGFGGTRCFRVQPALAHVFKHFSRRFHCLYLFRQKNTPHRHNLNAHTFPEFLGRGINRHLYKSLRAG